MIWLIQPLSVGNALRILISPPNSAARWKLLRRDVEDFSGEADPLALVVHEGTDKAVTDFKGLLNGEQVFYKLYLLINGIWEDGGPVASAVPGATMEDLGPDVMTLIRDRLEAGFKVYVERDEIRHDRNFVPVMTSSPQVEDTVFPMVTIHLQNQATEVRGVGEVSGLDSFDEEADLWLSVEGGFDRVQVTIAIWALNGDTRKLMRRALRAILQANLPIFDAAGLVTPSWSMQDLEDYQTYAAPMFQTICTFDCLAPASVQSTTPPIVEALALPTVLQP
ncbi:MAG: hypothetical protein ACJ75S_06730 [Solirubrobacterales bacterium]|jgi:hypothetical protein